MKTLLLSLAAILWLCCSCGKEQNTVEQISSRETLNINFNQNVLSLDSGKIFNEAELFINQITSTGAKPKYTLAISDSDILYQLTTHDSSQIKTISIRFLKNENAILDEFIDGKLDIIHFNQWTSTSTRAIDFYRQVKEDKYSNYSLIERKSGFVNGYTFVNFKDSSTLSTCVELLGAQNNHFAIDSAHFTPKIGSDTIKIPLVFEYHDPNLIHDTLQQDNVHIYPSESSDHLSNDPYIIWSSEYVNFLVDNRSTVADSLFNQMKSKNPRVNAYVAIKIYPDYYLTNGNLKGLLAHRSLAEQIGKVHFEVIKSY
ncbi:hypothetical protein N6H18_05620 [Reichenbachiella agarivorans]|uniref:Uncharacterized protein n=1 Tax=Reichenbachiella agarivorans TaxID=2979464 RepID=A0ABY6CSD2_9BACT|nr:hypothetical protein [Reichenbachiella agarivorans]UXP33429.1 hypothetical protein N6H18_05620 [Reichenbachiella agarivorans]